MVVNKNEVLDLMRPAMYWVSAMKEELESTRSKEEYVQQLEQHFGKNMLGVIWGHKHVTLVELSSWCHALYRTIGEWESTGDERATWELSEVLFYTGEIYGNIVRVKELLKMLGVKGDLDGWVNDLGVEFVGTSWRY